MTDKTKEVLRLALEALEYPGNVWHIDCSRNAAITAIKETLAEESSGAEQPAPKWQGVRFDSALHDQPAQPQQEPVAWMHVMDNTEGLKANGTGIVSITQKRKHPFGKPGVDFSKSYPVTSTPLYTSPQAQRTWVGLTGVEIASACKKHGGAEWWWRDIEEYGRAIEAKLKEKNSD